MICVFFVSVLKHLLFVSVDKLPNIVFVFANAFLVSYNHLREFRTHIIDYSILFIIVSPSS